MLNTDNQAFVAFNQLQRSKELLLCYQRFANRIDDLSEYKGRGVSHHQAKGELEKLRIDITHLKRKWDKEKN